GHPVAARPWPKPPNNHCGRNGINSVAAARSMPVRKSRLLIDAILRLPPELSYLHAFAARRIASPSLASKSRMITAPLFLDVPNNMTLWFSGGPHGASTSKTRGRLLHYRLGSATSSDGLGTSELVSFESGFKTYLGSSLSDEGKTILAISTCDRASG